jgi:tetratricopeptide (TPR) repeat protein
MADHRSPVIRRQSVGRVLIVVGLGLLVLWPLRSILATVVYNNVGSILLNRALLTPDLEPRERIDWAVRAGRSYQAALAWDPLNGQAYYNLSTIYDLWHDQASAARAVSRAAVLNPGDVSTRFGLGQALAAQGYGYDERTIREWQAAGASEYFLNQGLALAGTGDYAGAMEQYTRALAIDPDLPEGYYYLGRVLNRLGRQEEALAALESAAALEPPSSPRRYLLRAEVYVTRGEWEAALAAFGQAASVASWDPVPHYRMAWLYEQKLEDSESAIAHLQWALRLNPDYAAARLALARLYEAQEDCDEAARWLAPFLSPDAQVRLAGQAHTLLGECLLQQGYDREGLVHLEQAQALDPGSVGPLLALAGGYSQAGRYRDAIEAYLNVLELQPENSQAQQALEELGWFEP